MKPIFEAYFHNISDDLLIPGHEPKPLVHHYNHKAEKPPRGQAQRGRKLQFEDFEWYENSPIKSSDIPGRGERRRLPKRLFNSAPRQGQTSANVDFCEAASLNGFQRRVRMIGLTIDLVKTRGLEIPY